MAWGGNAAGQLNFPPSATNLVAIAAGWVHALALRADGRVIAWGSNYDGQTNVPPTLANVRSIAAGYYHSLAVRRDGSVAAWGSDQDVLGMGFAGQSVVPAGLTNVSAVAGGGFHSLALIGPAFITTPPVSQVTFYGATVAFSVAAGGIGPFIYQWFLDRRAHRWRDERHAHPGARRSRPGGPLHRARQQ